MRRGRCSDAHKDAFLKQHSENIDEQKTAGKGREPRFVRELVSPGFMGEFDEIQITKEEEIDTPYRIHE